MNRTELVAAIADRAGISKKDASAALDAFKDVVAACAKKGDEINLVGFMKFAVVDRPARTGRNPHTGEEIQIPAGKSIKATVSKSFSKAALA